MVTCHIGGSHGNIYRGGGGGVMVTYHIGGGGGGELPESNSWKLGYKVTHLGS